MNEYTIQEAIRALLQGENIEDTDLSEGVWDIQSYEDGGYLTYDSGLVFRTADGSEFQLTIKQSR